MYFIEIHELCVFDLLKVKCVRKISFEQVSAMFQNFLVQQPVRKSKAQQFFKLNFSFFVVGQNDGVVVTRIDGQSC